ncbi:tetratricopeptide repeat protein [Dokdonella sp.]|uniref:tetratricopeptide repeat protein n=1 Tax=Dokdonella sp. TaxID=2291710 RepID=UPI0035295383
MPRSSTDVYATIRSIYGDQHVRTADALYGLGVVHLAQGQYEQAETYLSQALQIMGARMSPTIHLSPAPRMRSSDAYSRADRCWQSRTTKLPFHGRKTPGLTRYA